MATLRITCDNCGAPLQYSKGETVQTCPYCKCTVTLIIKTAAAAEEEEEAEEISEEEMEEAEDHYKQGVALYYKRLNDEAIEEFEEA